MVSTREALADSGLLRTELFYGGQWREGSTGERSAVIDPATGEEIAQVAVATAEDVEAAIDAAGEAFTTWSKVPAPERSRILRRWYELVVAHADELAEILTWEQGKPLAEARGEVLYGAGFIEWFAEEAKRLYGEVIPTNNPNRRMMTTRSAVGVTAAITPWNFPSAMILRKASPALAAGCTMIIKPASETPLSAFALVALAEQAGIPAGVLSVVNGKGSVIGGIFTSHDLIRTISFTGSTEVGRTLMEQSAGTIKRLALELGGNAPLIVFDDADIETAVKGTMDSKFRNAGQTCVCANRIFVQAGIHDAFVAALAREVAKLRVGDGRDPETTQGPLISQSALEKVESHVADATAKGGTIVNGGARSDLGGTFYSPTVIVGATPEMRVASEETFGPIAPVFKFTTEEEAIELANDTEFGLAGYFFSRDIGRVTRVAEALEVGVVGVNTGLISYEGAPFGGVKQSGIGREGSMHGIEEYTELKYICIEGVL
ncbi:NAD-dependent succinate-semialdehyde dehydrogenase [Leucobacter soli]|uniref:Succinate-semialdehyde dehydrogenase [NADP(+)] GabD n=1 Tax=Leucobacter soli TaxID=2812850 RepID=A0A916JW67_9MICO|nr:NAD-dependent succinate-semialdehyde dehydrogenase [Leucobacter soli]CAG7606146.1 Succinate-semialdehyde dehydrogenase [NADP(+)] GabD [Leucobacter soli]